MATQKNTYWEPKSKLAGFFVFFILIVAGVCAGLLLQKLTAPDSKAANVISVAMLPASVVIGAIAWQVIIIIFIFIKRWSID